MGDWWQAVIDTLVADFSDLPNAAEATRITVRLLIAALLGGLLGYEREQQGKSAGVRTHMLVAIGAALFVLIPQQAGVSEVEMSRVIQGVIAGVGFLGAGTIIKGGDDEHVRGLTTAAGIWLTAAIGLAAGLGRESSAILCTLLALLILSLAPKVERWLGRRRK
ncbi:methyltransferase [Thiocystis minor]|uniref:MgtC/SapB family protein n=1 Tax=Thiocystis minor TaxID=61597 RepID=UPI0019139083|nr:MgtC/SapB family protein [Thiocystis minor]MBK5966277.1 methyltransferase [Thiocystis minor]